jgi:type IV pilus assembly protein PilV
MNTRNSLHAQSGFTMLEILVTILILLLGLLGLAGLQTRAHTAELESYQRVQALILAWQIIDRIRANRHTAPCFAITNPAVGTQFVGAAGAGHFGVPACASGTIAENNLADAALNEWDAVLQGAAESKGGADVGAMIGARGCISYDATTELVDPSTGAVIAGTGLYTVVVAWQGLTDSVAPTVNCANGLYGTEEKRRVVSMSWRMAQLL